MWEKPDPEPDLAGYYIGRGDNLKTNFKPVHDKIIPPESTSFIDYNADRLSGNYYVVAAVDTAGNGSISMVSYAAVIDSIPPAAPSGLEGHIDTTGVVTIKWRLGKEPDLAGYMIYFSNSAEHVFSSVNKKPLADTVFTDTIQIKTLTRHIYYRVKAVDTRWNYSDYSEILVLTRPDLIPPTKPVFTDYEITDKGIKMRWIPSSSTDVAGYELRVGENGKEERKIFIPVNKKAEELEFTDRDAGPGMEYRYVLHTVDESGLRSEPSYPLTVRTPNKRPDAAVTDLTIEKDMEKRGFLLRWSLPEDVPVSRYVLYRAAAGAHFAAYKSIPGAARSFRDHLVRNGIEYEYALKIIFDSGKESPFSNVVSGRFE